MDQKRMTKVLGISGSLRRGSLNTAALRAAQEPVPDGMEITITDIAQIPVYNEDLRAEQVPTAVQTLADAIAQADAVLIATPEYNYSIPGGLKNALNWVSRVPKQPFANKPVAIMGVSPGAIGTARAQYHLRQVFVFLDAKVLNKPEIMIGGALERFDDQGRLHDQKTRDFIGSQLAALRTWTDVIARRPVDAA